MSQSIIRTTVCSFATLLLIGSLTAQNTASISGIVKDGNNKPVPAIVTAVSGSVAARTATKLDGSFTLTNLTAGTHALCAQVPTTIYAANEDRFVDTCVWQDPASPRVAVTAGQAVTGVAVVLQRGHLVQVRLNDPAAVLSSVKGGTGDVFVHIAGPSGLVRFVPIASTDHGGRTHEIVIPYSQQHKLWVESTKLNLVNAALGAALSGPIPIFAALGATPSVYTVNISAGVKP